MRAAAAKTKPSRKKKTAKAKPLRSKAASAKTGAPRKKRSRAVASRDTAAEIRSQSPYTDVDAGDLQGLSRAEEADSESVDELVEEGNALEAGVVAGVEHADDTEGREVHTHEVPEDDVPEEYLDEK